MDALPRARGALFGRCILVLEDESLIAFELADIVADHGGTPIGPVRSAEHAIAALQTCAIDAALVDINLRDRTDYALPDFLAARHVPFVFVTGYSRMQISARHRGVPVIEKPFTSEQICRTLVALLTPH